MNKMVVKDNVEFIDEDFSEETGFDIETPWDVEGADILLIHNAGEILHGPKYCSLFHHFQKPPVFHGPCQVDLAAYDSINYGVFL